MKLCILGHMEVPPVEGTRKAFACLVEGMSKHMTVLPLQISHLPALLRARRFSPDVLHAILGPSSRMSLPVVRLWANIVRPRLVLLSALQCTIPIPHKSRSRWNPRLVLTQSAKTQKEFIQGGWSCEFEANGVDSVKFHPVTAHFKQQVRQELGLPEDKLLMLHVGPIKLARNVEWLTGLNRSDRHLVVVSRPRDPGDSSLARALKAEGAEIITEYQPRIELFYQASDLYLFTASDPRSCVETPLSVLEAYACGVPVITTPFGALPRVLSGQPGVRFCATRDEFVNEVERGPACAGFPSHEFAERLDWRAICSR